MTTQSRIVLANTTGLRYWSTATLLGLLWITALLIAWRRMANAIDVPLQPALLLAVGVVIAAAAASVRLVRRYFPAALQTSRPDWLLPLLTSLAMLVLAMGLSLRGTDALGLAAFWAVLLAEEVWAWRPAVWRSPKQQHRLASTYRAASDPPDQNPLKIAMVTAQHMPAGDVLQQTTRSQASDGSEQLSGWLRAPFATGQRTAIVHLAFCPQFANAPELTVEQTDGPELQRVNQAVFSFGARVDLKLAEVPEEPRDVLLHFSARSAPPAMPPNTP